jgi:hypothetical protein
MRPAGTCARANSFCLDGTKPLAGLAGDSPVSSPTTRRSPTAVKRVLFSGDNTDIVSLPNRGVRSPHLTGGLPRQGVKKQQVCPPGYSGHIAGKVSENLHGATFAVEKERAVEWVPAREMLRQSLSSPQLRRCTLDSLGENSSPSRGMRAIPRLPGYSGHIPGKMAESVYGTRFAESNEEAQCLRRDNPHTNSDGWLRRSNWPCDQAMTYKWISGRSSQMDGCSHFSRAQEEEISRANARLGHAFGCSPAEKNLFVPGDRYIHASSASPCKEVVRINPAAQEQAGASSYSPLLDKAREHERSHY